MQKVIYINEVVLFKHVALWKLNKRKNQAKCMDQATPRFNMSIYCIHIFSTTYT